LPSPDHEELTAGGATSARAVDVVFGHDGLAVAGHRERRAALDLVDVDGAVVGAGDLCTTFGE
jgi:hypothetical protein